MIDYFKYNDGRDIIPEDVLRISPSQLNKFFDTTHQWWAENFYDEAGFEGNTASELGNCVHAAAAMYFDSGQVDKTAIEQYINSISNPEVDNTEIQAQWKIMSEKLINDFLMRNKGTESEPFVGAEVIPGVWAAGSIDMYDENKATIYDYKTTGSLDRARIPTSFPRSYWFQQMTYAWIQRQNGNPVDHLELVYITRDNCGRISEKTGKPMKDYPSEVHRLKHTITSDDMEIITSCLNLVAESIRFWQDNPEYRHLITQDMRRKEKPKPKIFKD